MDDKNELKGLGGWLTLLGFGLLISPIRNIAISILSWSDVYESGTWWTFTNSDSISYIPYWGSLIIFELAFGVILFLASIYLLFLFFGEKETFPKTYITVAVAAVLFPILDSILAWSVISTNEIFDEQTKKETLTLLISAGIWIPYLLNSKRVRNTFIKYANTKKELKISALFSIIATFCLVAPLLGDEPLKSELTTVCKPIQLRLFTFRSIEWGSNKKIAKVFFDSNVVEAEITSISEHNNGNKINFIIHHENPYYGADITEYVVFPAFNTYRAIGATYKYDGNSKLLNTIQKSVELECKVTRT